MKTEMQSFVNQYAHTSPTAAYAEDRTLNLCLHTGSILLLNYDPVEEDFSGVLLASTPKLIGCKLQDLPAALGLATVADLTALVAFDQLA